MEQLGQDAVEAMYDEAQSGANADLTQAEMAFTEGADAWHECPVDGTRFFHKTDRYPIGAESGNFCSTACAALASLARRRAALGMREALPGEVADEVAEEGELEREKPTVA